MSLSSKVMMSFLAGTFAALLAWVIIDFNGVYSLSNGASTASFSQLFSQQAFLGMIFGAFVGVAIGLVNGMSAGSSKSIQRNVKWGAGVGILGGLIGLFFGQMFFGVLYKSPQSISPLSPFGPFIFVWDVIVRAIGWAFIGGFLGLAQGIPSKSKRSARHGAIGGLIGGFLGGTLFEIVPYLLPPGIKNPSVISRGISLTITGASIGLFIGLVETLLKQAWIRVVQGRNEGREYIISKPRTTIGRDELADIGLFGDRDISPAHAVIDLQNGRYTLRDTGTQVGTSVNGRRVAEQVLRDGDLIQIGTMSLEFHEKAAGSRAPMPVDRAPEPPAYIPVVEGTCPFCGERKDSRTGQCACSVGAQMPFQQPSSPSTTVMSAGPQVQGLRLTGVSGQYAGRQFTINPAGDTTIGRESDQAVQLPLDATVSRRHARIECQNSMCIVHDLQSSNGTTVNGMRITSQPISPGDTVSFGAAAFRFEQ